MMAEFTDRKPHPATAGQVKLAHWRCRKCGHKFLEGQIFRWVWLTGHNPGHTNILVCPPCDDGDDALYEWVREWDRKWDWLT